nr:hypothetical protein [Acidobacteriota bacterium]
MPKRIRLFACLFSLWPILLEAEPAKIPHGTVELVSAVSSIQPDSSFQVGLFFQLEPGWHIYWKNPGDSGQPPRITWKLPNELTPGEIEWPAPKRLPVGPLLDYGYEGNVLLPITFQAGANLRNELPQALQANLRVLICRETCMPGKASLSLTLPVRKGAAEPVTANQKLFSQANEAKPQALPSAWKASAQQSASEITLSVSGLPSAATIDFIPVHPNQIENAAAQKKTAAGLILKKPAAAKADRSTLDGLLYVEKRAYN